MGSEKSGFQSPLIIALVAFGVIGFLWWQKPAILIRPTQILSQALLKPFETITSAGAYSTRSLVVFITSIHNLKEENESLEKEKLRLLVENTELRALGSENEELRKSLSLLPREKYNLLGTEVIARDGSGQNNSVIINRGERDGVRQGMGALVEAGVLVGRVTEVFPSSARVMFITSRESIVNVETANNQVKGVAEGDHGIGLRLNMVQQGQTLSDGDIVVTSGLGGSFPKGLLVGTLSDIRLSEDKLFQQAAIQLPANVETLRFLYLIR